MCDNQNSIHFVENLVHHNRTYKLIVPDSVTNIFNISDHCGVILVGNMNDARYLVTYMRSQAAEYKFKYQYEIPIHVLA